MTWGMAEDLVNAILAAQQAGLPAKLDALQSEYVDDPPILLPPPIIWVVGEQELDRLHTMPALFVIADEVGFDNFRGSMTFVPEIGARIGLLCDDEDPSRLRRKAYRYGRAIFEVLTDAKRAPGGIGGWQPIERGSIQYSTPLVYNSAFIIDVTLAWTYTKQEDR